MRQYLAGLASGLVFGWIAHSFYLGFRMKQVEQRIKRRAELMLDCVWETKKARERDKGRD